MLDALRIRHVGVEGFEADDVIATLTTQAVAQGAEVVICTGDRDAFQLVSDQVSLIYPVRGVSEVWRMDPAAVTEKYLVPPERYSDLAALVGETSDNLPGVPGVGPKTAAKWLGQYGDLAGVVAHVDEIKGKAGESLREHLDGVLRNRRLNRLVTDLELPLSVDDLERQSWDREEVHQVFDGLEFRVLRERLFATFEVEQDEVEGGFDLEGDVFTADDLGVRFGDGAVGRAVPHGVVVVGQYRGGNGDAGAVALAGADGSTAYLDLTALTREQEDVLAGWLADPSAPKVLHDAKEQLQALSTRGLTLAGVTSDTALAAYLVRPDQRSYDLEDLVVRHLGRELKAEEAASPPGQLLLDCRGRRRHRGPRRDGAGPGGARAVGRARRAARRDRRHRAAARPRAAAGRASWRGWSAPASPSTSRRWPSSRPTSPPRCARRSRTPTTPSAARTSTSAAPSSCRRCSSTSSACPRPSAPRPGTPRMPTRSPTCSPRPSTRSSRRCCATATPPGCGSPSRG